MTDDERDARIDTLTDAIADTSRSVAETNRTVAGLATHVASLTADVASLSRLMRTHLIVDHGYPEIGDDDDV